MFEMSWDFLVEFVAKKHYVMLHSPVVFFLKCHGEISEFRFGCFLALLGYLE